jgi:hypothetical protein
VSRQLQLVKGLIHVHLHTTGAVHFLLVICHTALVKHHKYTFAGSLRLSQYCAAASRTPHSDTVG